MKSVKLLIIIGSLCAAFAFGCTTESVGPDNAAQESTSTVEQDIGGGDDICAGWTACYNFCRRLYQCTNPQRCNLQLTCLTNCDSSYPGAPGSCPYPE